MSFKIESFESGNPLSLAKHSQVLSRHVTMVEAVIEGEVAYFLVFVFEMEDRCREDIISSAQAYSKVTGTLHEGESRSWHVEDHRPDGHGSLSFL